MARERWVSISWALAGVLAISAGMMVLGKQESEADPSPTNYGPSGTAAFAELLRRNGYSVSATRFENPRIPPEALVISFEDAESVTLVDQQDQFQLPAARRAVSAHIERGGRALVMTLDKEIPKTVEAPKDSIPVGDRKLNIVGALARALPLGLDALPANSWRGVPLLESTVGGHLAEIGRMGRGLAVGSSAGLLATNRFIAEGDNAEALMRAVKVLAPTAGPVIFTEATYVGGIQPGLTAMIGPWAEAAWFQILFLGALVVYTLGLRFGYPEVVRRRERGQRELLDAISDTYRRSRRTDDALEAAHAACDRRLRGHLKIPADASDDVLRRTLPGELYELLKSTKTAGPMSSRAALALAQKLERQTDAFLESSGRSGWP